MGFCHAICPECGKMCSPNGHESLWGGGGFRTFDCACGCHFIRGTKTGKFVQKKFLFFEWRRFVPCEIDIIEVQCSFLTY